MSMSLAEKYEYQAKVLAALEQELAPLRAKAEAYDKGKEAWVLFHPDGFMMPHTLSNTEFEAWEAETPDHGPTTNELMAVGYTCRKVQVVKEIEKE